MKRGRRKRRRRRSHTAGTAVLKQSPASCKSVGPDSGQGNREELQATGNGVKDAHIIDCSIWSCSWKTSPSHSRSSQNAVHKRGIFPRSHSVILLRVGTF